MRDGVPSRTALGVALRRAAHQLLDHPRVFEDPLATKIIGPYLTAANQRRAPTLRAFLAVRSRYAEDALAAFVATGGTQFVVLGAGLDTFAYRNPHSPALQVFEVDHPDTQAWKMQLLRASGIPIPDSLTFLPVDFETRNLADALTNTPTFDKRKKTFFSWLGVTPYLTMKALEATLSFIASLPAGSGVVFDYALHPSHLAIADKLALKLLSLRVAAAGESFRLFLDPQQLSARLQDMGFTRLEDLGQRELNNRYFQARRDGLRIRSGIGRILRAIK